MERLCEWPHSVDGCHLYTIGFADDEDFMNYIDMVQGWSIQNTGVTVEPDDKIITLSTCVNNNADRLIVQARRLEP